MPPRDSDEIDLSSTFREAVEDHQFSAKRLSTALHGDLIGERAKLKLFHRDLVNPNTSLSDLAAQAKALSDLPFEPIGLDGLGKLRNLLATTPLQFTATESPAAALAIGSAYSRVSRFAFHTGVQPDEVLFATDSLHRPHASVQEWDSRKYLLLLNRYLIVDAYTLCLIVASVIVETTREDPDQVPWEHSGFAEKLVAATSRSTLITQLPYAMASSFAGERYRLAYAVPADASNSELLAKVTHELMAGVLDFIVGHELAHISLGHLERSSGAPRDAAWHLKQTVERYGLDELADRYLAKYWPTHGLEIEADLESLVWTAGDGPAGAWDLRLMGAQLASCQISFFDRARYLTTNREDPVDVVGLRNYGAPGLIDLLLPIPTHPWGKTRSTILMSSVEFLYSEFFSPGELLRKATLMRTIGDMVGRVSAQALQVVRWIEARPGEFVSFQASEGVQTTLVWPPGFRVGLDEHETMSSKTTEYYADVASDLPTGIFIEEDYGRTE